MEWTPERIRKLAAFVTKTNGTGMIKNFVRVLCGEFDSTHRGKKLHYMTVAAWMRRRNPRKPHPKWLENLTALATALKFEQKPMEENKTNEVSQD